MARSKNSLAKTELGGDNTPMPEYPKIIIPKSIIKEVGEVEQDAPEHVTSIAHTSYSQMSMYLRCSMQYFFRYILHLKDKLKVSLSIGGWNDGNNSAFESFAASSGGRTTFTNAVMGLINQYNLDGVDIDWEYPDPGTSGNNFTALMSQLSTAMHSRGKLLTAAVVSGGSTANGVQPAVFGYVDFLNIMTYDGGSPHANYDWTIQNTTLPNRAPMPTPRSPPRATHASTACWLGGVGWRPPPMSIPLSLNRLDGPRRSLRIDTGGPSTATIWQV